MVYVQREYVRCGKPRCHCASAGDPGHGPYWYGYFRDGTRLRSVYIGRVLPGKKESAPRSEKPREEDVPERFQWNGTRMSALEAMRVLAVGTIAPEVVTRAYRAAIRRWHPDLARTEQEREQYHRISQALNVARDVLVRTAA